MPIEMAKKSLLDTLAPKPTASDLDRIAEQIHAANPVPNAPAGPAKTSREASPTPPEPAADKSQHRLTIDLPRWLVEQIRNDGKKNGVTVRGVILGHLLNIYKES